MTHLSVASIPSRQECLRSWLAWALSEPVGRIHVYLDGYEAVPEWLHGDNVEVRASAPAGDDPRMAALGKFAWAHLLGDHIITDDDIRYPKGYVTTTLCALNNLRREHGPVAVTHHGSIVTGQYVSHYSPSARVTFPYMQRRKGRQVHIPGTGVMAFRAPEVNLSAERFSNLVGIDSEAAVLLKDDGIPVWVLSAERGYLMPRTNHGPSIVSSSLRADGSPLDTSITQTNTIRAAFPWPELPGFLPPLQPSDIVMAATQTTFRSAQELLSVPRRKRMVSRSVGTEIIHVPGPARSFEFRDHAFPPQGKTLTEAEADELRNHPWCGVHYHEVKVPVAPEGATEPTQVTPTEVTEVPAQMQEVIEVANLQEAAEILAGWGVDADSLLFQGKIAKARVLKAAEGQGITFSGL